MNQGANRLTPEQARKFAIMRMVMIGSMLGAGVTFCMGLALLFVPGTSTGVQAAVWAVFIEMAVSSAVLGAFARCPACRARLGGQSRGLLPPRCPGCGVSFEPAAD